MAFSFNHDGYKRAIEENFTIVDKKKQEVPFLLNRAQDHFVQNAQERNVILKARKMGFSSVLLAIGTIKFLLGRNERCVSMSFDATASGKQLERAKQYIRSYERINKVKVPLKYNSKHELVYERLLENGETIINTFRIGTAKSNGFGRGDDITFLHLTEVSLADNLEELLAGVGEAMVYDSMVSLETTANGFNPFKTFWDASVLGERGYQALFYNPPWEYDAIYLERKRKELGRLFKQEYPMTPEEAFITSGDTYFDTLALQSYLESVKDVKQLAYV